MAWILDSGWWIINVPLEDFLQMIDNNKFWWWRWWIWDIDRCSDLDVLWTCGGRYEYKFHPPTQWELKILVRTTNQNTTQIEIQTEKEIQMRIVQIKIEIQMKRPNTDENRITWATVLGDGCVETLLTFLFLFFGLNSTWVGISNEVWQLGRDGFQKKSKKIFRRTHFWVLVTERKLPVHMWNFHQDSYTPQKHHHIDRIFGWWP